jgi:hypothetical protein
VTRIHRGWEQNEETDGTQIGRRLLTKRGPSSTCWLVGANGVSSRPLQRKQDTHTGVASGNTHPSVKDLRFPRAYLRIPLERTGRKRALGECSE